MNETTGTPATDAELITLAQSGEVEAFGHLYERYLDRIYRYIRARVGQDRVAEDIAEMVFLRSFESLDGYEDRGYPFSAYLYQVARNLLVDHYRQPDDHLPLQRIDGKESSSPDSEELAIQQEKMAVLVEALTRLPDEYQEVIRLRVLMQLPTAETAKWMSRSDGAVRVLLHRAMKALKRQAEEIYES
ncbi:MAG: sigma-70 family RNA polymerase sigma factor [Anaerolineales bacterium]|nr:sigma-70 family RNA polymerase sigma factor [Anaerolineales bacterium]